MILPHPETNFSLNIMILGVDIIKYLKDKNDFVLFETVLNDFLEKEEKRTPEMFIRSISFLYLLGVIEKKDYRIKLNPKNIYSQQNLF